VIKKNSKRKEKKIWMKILQLKKLKLRKKENDLIYVYD
jgi:hypothetical protein